MTVLHDNMGRGDVDIAHGVSCYPVGGDKLTVFYNGLLTKSGADQCWLRSGTGEPQNWQNQYDHYMMRTPAGFECTFDLFGAQKLNFCFKDSANHWDNNNGLNWCYQK